MAEQILKTKIPDRKNYIQKATEMLEFFGDLNIKISAGRTQFDIDSKVYKFPAKKDGESPVDFGERFLKEFMLACLEIKELNKARLAKMIAVEALDIVPEDVPNESVG